MIGVVLADDHPIVRQGLKALLEAEKDFQIVGEAADGLSVSPLVERLKPDVVVLDMMMPGLHGLDVIPQIRQRSPQTQVLVLSMHENEAYVLQALKKGAAGYFLKRCPPGELVQAVREVAAGRRYLSADLSQRALEAYIEKAEDDSLDPYSRLTSREREVMHLAVEGNSNVEIGARLFISPRTVEHHRENMMHKLGLRSHTDLVRYALRKGILPMED